MDVRELVRRLRAGERDRAIARDMGIARKTVARYRVVAKAEGMLEGPLVDAAELNRLLEKRVTEPTLPDAAFKAAAYRETIEALRRAAVPAAVIFQRLRDEHSYTGSASSVWRYVRTLEAAEPEAFVRIEVAPGEEAQVDFGYAGMMVDPQTQQLRKAWAFVMTLSHSRHQYARFVFDQTIATWLHCHELAFRHFGGVPKKIVLDNLKAAIVKAALHDPVVQRSYREFAEHYGFLISPCRPRTPRHKGKVESGVKYLVRSFLAGRAFRDIVEANERVLDWIEFVAGVRIHGTTKERPLARFIEVEAAALLSLPVASYDCGIWKKVKLHPDCHVVVGGAFYSAPHRLIGQTLWARTNGRDVVLFHDYERIATHAWGPPGTRRTESSHYPPHKVAKMMACPRYCRGRAAEIGPATEEVIGALLDERPLDRLRTAQAVLGLAAKHGPNRLEAACRRALLFDDATYATIKRVLVRGLENDPLPEFAQAPPEPRIYLFARPGSEIFNQGGPDHGSQVPARSQAQGLAVVGHPGDA